MAIPFRDDEETGAAAGVRQGYANATRVSPLTRRAHEQVLGGYGLRIGWAKGQSDTAISREAARAVLEKFKADQAAARANNQTPPASNNPGSGGAPSPSYQGQPSAPGTPGGAPIPAPAPVVGVGGTGGAGAPAGGGEMLPNTSVGAGTAAPLPSLIRAPLQHNQVQSLLQQYGLYGETPPPSVTTDAGTLIAWINNRVAELEMVRSQQVQARPPTMYEPESVASQTSTPQTLMAASGPISVDRAIQIKNEYGRPDIMLGMEGTAAREQILSSEATYRQWLEGAIAAANQNLSIPPSPTVAPTIQQPLNSTVAGYESLYQQPAPYVPPVIRQPVMYEPVYVPPAPYVPPPPRTTTVRRATIR